MAEHPRRTPGRARRSSAEEVPYIFTLCGGHVMPIYDGCLDEGIASSTCATSRPRRTPPTAGRASPAARRRGGHRRPGPHRRGHRRRQRAARQHPDAHHRRAGAAAVRRHGLAAGHEPRRADAADHQVGGVGARGRGASPSTSAWPSASPPPACPGPVFLEMPIDQLFDTYDEERDLASRRSTAPRPASPAIRATSSGAFALLQQRRAAGGAGRAASCAGRAARGLSGVRRAPSACRSTSTASAAARCRPTIRTSSRRRARTRCSNADVVLIFGTPLDFRLGYGRDSHINPDAKLIQVDLDGARDRPQPADRRRHRRRHRPGHGAAHAARAQGGGLQRGDGRSRGSTSMRQRETAEVGEDAAASSSPTRCRSTRCAPARRSPTSLGERRHRHRRRRRLRRDRGVGAAHLRSSGHWLDPGPARHARRRPGLRDGGQARQAAERRSSSSTATARSACTGWSSRPASGRRSTSSASSATTPRGRRSAAARCSSTARSARSRPALSFTRYDKVVEALGGHGEYVERPEQIRPAMERALGAGKPALVNIKIGEQRLPQGCDLDLRPTRDGRRSTDTRRR